jgi:hypothetical protein
MNTLYAFIVCFGLVACDQTSSIKTTTPPLRTLADGTLAIDSGQGGEFEITVLPLDKGEWGESNNKATNASKIDVEIDRSVRITVSNTKVIRIQGLQKRRHFLVESIDGVKSSSFSVDGTSVSRLVADYYETYGTWMIREPLNNK